MKVFCKSESLVPLNLPQIPSYQVLVFKSSKHFNLSSKSWELFIFDRSDNQYYLVENSEEYNDGIQDSKKKQMQSQIEVYIEIVEEKSFGVSSIPKATQEERDDLDQSSEERQRGQIDQSSEPSEKEEKIQERRYENPTREQQKDQQKQQKGEKRNEQQKLQQEQAEEDQECISSGSSVELNEPQINLQNSASSHVAHMALHIIEQVHPEQTIIQQSNPIEQLLPKVQIIVKQQVIFVEEVKPQIVLEAAQLENSVVSQRQAQPQQQNIRQNAQQAQQVQYTQQLQKARQIQQGQQVQQARQVQGEQVQQMQQMQRQTTYLVVGQGEISIQSNSHTIQRESKPIWKEKYRQVLATCSFCLKESPHIQLLNAFHYIKMCENCQDMWIVKSLKRRNGNHLKCKSMPNRNQSRNCSFCGCCGELLFKVGNYDILSCNICRQKWQIVPQYIISHCEAD